MSAPARAVTAAPSLAGYFSTDYATARARFRASARGAGAALHELPIAATGPQGERLTIDIAWLGAADARIALLHTSGIHGVEAFAGAAIQLALLDDPPALDAGTAVVLVHVLNPFGMAWLRRANENNVDLNRNFLGGDERWSGAPPLYRALDPLLNPCTPPRPDAFLARAAARVLRHGYRPVKQAVAQGQYDFPRGLFYGGGQLEEGPRRYLDWVAQHLSKIFTVLAIDVHTGLGNWAVDTLLVQPPNPPSPGLDQALGRALTDAAVDDSTAYVVRGGLTSGVRRAIPHVPVHGIVQEFGTYPMLRVIAALRDENRWHLHGAGTLAHPSKQALRRALCPEDEGWRARVVNRGLDAARAAVGWLRRKENIHGM